MGGCVVDPAVEALAYTATCVLARLGGDEASVPEVLTTPWDYELAERIAMVTRAGFFRDLMAMFENFGMKWRKVVKPELLWNVDLSHAAGFPALEEALQGDVQQLEREVSALFDGKIDMLCTPCTISAAFDADVRYLSVENNTEFHNYLEWMMPTYRVTHTFCPCLSSLVAFSQMVVLLACNW